MTAVTVTGELGKNYILSLAVLSLYPMFGNGHLLPGIKEFFFINGQLADDI